MVTNVSDQERLSESLREEDLINGAAGRRTDMDRVLALKELLRRRIAGRTQRLRLQKNRILGWRAEDAEEIIVHVLSGACDASVQAN